MRSEKEKMLAGELYDPLEGELIRARERARDLCQDLNASREKDQDARRRILTELFGKGGDSVWMQPPFFCDYGSNILLGERVFFNFNCVVLDVCQVEIGDFTLFGPAVQIYTPMHPMNAELRRTREFGKPIKIGSDVWVGGGAIICPGVKIGSKTVIGAGSVVTRDIPDGVFAAGNPCRVIREITGREHTMSDVPDRSTFASLYSSQAPWDIGRPQKAFLDVADQITGSILDAGCGTADNALFFASRGHKVTGIDFLEEPIKRAKGKAGERTLPVTFLVKDATTLKDWSERFDSVIDCGLFHVFSDDDRTRYVAGLATVLKSGGCLFLLCFSNDEPGTQGPRRVSQQELHDTFAEGWAVESIQPSRFEVIPNLKNFTFSEGGPKAWFAVVRREG